jgi:hypothetical protein
MAFICFIPVHPVHPRRKKTKDDAEELERIAPKHPASYSTGMNRMDGDEEDKIHEINIQICG